MARSRPNLEKAVNDLLARHGVDGKRLSYRQAERLTGLSPATIGELAKGNARTAETVRRFAQGLGEDTQRLLLLAGFAPEDVSQSVAEDISDTTQETFSRRETTSAPDTDDADLLQRLERALRRLPPGPDRALWQTHLLHTIELLERYTEKTTEYTE